MITVNLIEPCSVSARGMAAGALAAGVAGSAAVWYFDPATASFFPVCPLYRFTGFACPGCGLTRGFHALFHGDIVAALDYNALIPLWVAVFAYLLLSLLLLAVRGRGFSISFFHPAVVFGLLVVLIAFGVLRNLPFYPFTVLFP